jgi:hypothetical protein
MLQSIVGKRSCLGSVVHGKKDVGVSSNAVTTRDVGSFDAVESQGRGTRDYKAECSTSRPATGSSCESKTSLMKEAHEKQTEKMTKAIGGIKKNVVACGRERQLLSATSDQRETAKSRVNVQCFVSVFHYKPMKYINY